MESDPMLNAAGVEAWSGGSSRRGGGERRKACEARVSMTHGIIGEPR